MNSKTGTVKITDTQYQKLIETISSRLYHYQIGFVKIKKIKSSLDLIPSGSGTLVEIDGIYGILTAQHVIDGLPKCGDIGLILYPGKHKYVINSDFLNKIKVAKGSIESEGPDLGVILLAHPDVINIKAIKSFYNLSRNRNKILNKPPKNYKGIWFLCGVPAAMTTVEMTTMEGSSEILELRKRFTLFCGANMKGVEEEYKKGEYDYFEINALCKGTKELPKSLEGISGGGLWQVILSQQKGELVVEEMILSGVVFYQSSLRNDVRSIKCHGRRSVYKKAIDVVKKCAPNKL